jgi:hypothetical protein
MASSERKTFPAILVLDTYKSYGSIKANKKGRMRYLYLAVSTIDNVRVTLLVPYDLKEEFSKKRTNMFILASLNKEKLSSGDNGIQCGHLEHVFGSVECPESFSEYELYRRGLNKETSGLRNACTKLSLSGNGESLRGCKSGNTSPKIRVATIDKIRGGAHDDALYFDPHDPGEVCVLISNVSNIVDRYDLWKLLPTHSSNIYLPHRTVQMFPRNFCADFLSLNAGTTRNCIRFRFRVSEGKKSIRLILTEIDVVDALIDFNFVYEEFLLMESEWYLSILEITRKVESGMRNEGGSGINSSHDVISFWMRQTCIHGGGWLARLQKGSGIGGGMFHRDFPRSSLLHLGAHGNVIAPTKYVPYASLTTGTETETAAETTYYAHMTSPIRRLVDFCNLTLLLLLLDPSLMWRSRSIVEGFLCSQSERLEDINREVKSIRRLELECHTLARIRENVELLESLHNGVLVEYDAHDGKGVVHIPKEHLFARVFFFDTPSVDIKDLFSSERDHWYRIVYTQNKSTLRSKVKAILWKPSDP